VLDGGCQDCNVVVAARLFYPLGVVSYRHRTSKDAKGEGGGSRPSQREDL
jgi:hypothetical protein